jgi:hypothetical protein
VQRGKQTAAQAQSSKVHIVLTYRPGRDFERVRLSRRNA